MNNYNSVNNSNSTKTNRYFSWDHALEKKYVEFPLIQKSTTINKQFNKKKSLIQKIDDFTSLPDNWDYYGAKAIGNEIVKKSIELVSKLTYLPDVFPTPRNTIQLEYEYKDKYLEIEIFDKHFQILTIIDNIEKEYKEVNEDVIIQLANSFNE